MLYICDIDTSERIRISFILKTSPKFEAVNKNNNNKKTTKRKETKFQVDFMFSFPQDSCQPKMVQHTSRKDLHKCKIICL